VARIRAMSNDVCFTANVSHFWRYIPLAVLLSTGDSGLLYFASVVSFTAVTILRIICNVLLLFPRSLQFRDVKTGLHHAHALDNITQNDPADRPVEEQRRLYKEVTILLVLNNPNFNVISTPR
jgi:hypothetical protein